MHSLRFIAILFMLISGHLIVAQEKTETPPGNGYIIQLETAPVPKLPANYEELKARHIFAIAWSGKSPDNLKYARQMGYNRIVYKAGMENLPEAENFYFLFESPEYFVVYPTLGAQTQLVIKKDYPKEIQEMYKNYFALRDAKAPFPLCLGTGWPIPNKGPKVTVSFTPLPDFQQQHVIDYFVNKTFEAAKKLERPSKKFLFGGIGWDVSDLCGDFHNIIHRFDPNDKDFNMPTPVSIKDMKNREKDKNKTTALVNDCTDLYPGTTHQYATYSDGKAAYFLALKERAARDFPKNPIIFMIEPYRIYENWIKTIEDRPDSKKLMKNFFVVSESGGKFATEFADDARIFKSGLVTRDWVGSTVPNDHDFAIIKEIAGKAAIHGSWFGWFGRFDGPRKNSNYKSINAVYQIHRWEQLTREVASWDNLNAVPLAQRSWNGKEYVSTNSKISDDIIYSRQPKTQKLFAVFMNSSGTIQLKPGEKIVSIKKVDNFFCETEDASSDFNVSSDKITLKSKPVN